MLLIVAAAISGGLVTVATLGSFSLLAALITAPIVASAMAVLAALLIAWRNANERTWPNLDAQADGVVTALRGVAQQAKATAPDLRSNTSFDRAA
jgi:hypothetical protein